jgi:hypothetical protein
MTIVAQVGEIFGLISLVINTGGRVLFKFKGELFVSYCQISLFLTYLE